MEGWVFDHVDPWLAPRLHQVFAAVRTDRPMAYTTRHGGFWAAMTYRAVRQAAADPATFSSAGGISIPPLFGDIRLPPIDVDEPEHTAYRKVIQPYFGRRAVARHEPMLRTLIRTRLAHLVAKGSADLASELARHIPPMAIAAILGLPQHDGQRFVAWMTRLFAAAARGDRAGRRSVTREIRAYTGDRLHWPRDEWAVMSAIARGRIGDRPLTRQEQIGMISLLVVAGHETMVHALGTLLYQLASVDDLRRRLAADPALLPDMIAESLRLEPPVIGVARTVRGTARLQGRSLGDKERVLLVLASANRDPAVFDRPDAFVCPRPRNPHLAFGAGIHRCVGEHLALLEMRIVAEEILAIAPRYRIAAGYRPDWLAGRIVRGLTTLPVIFG